MSTERDDITDAEVAGKLRGAVDLLNEKGWAYQRWYDGDAMCALSAIRESCGVMRDSHVATRDNGTPKRVMDDNLTMERYIDGVRRVPREGRLYERVRQALVNCLRASGDADVPSYADPHGHALIPDWNDAEDQTGEHVKQAMSDCADRLDSPSDDTTEAAS